MSTLPQRIFAGFLTLGCVAGLSTACSDDPGGEDAGADAVADAETDGGDAGDAADDTGASDTGPGTDGPAEDTGSVDTGPAGDQVQAGSLDMLPPMPASCSDVGERYRIPFYFKRQNALNTGQLPPIRKGDVIDGQTVRPDSVIGPGVLTTRRMRVSEASRSTCESAAQCGQPLKCGESGVRGADRFCSRSTGVEFLPGTTRQDYEPNISEDSGQVVAIALQNTGTYEGYLPSSVGTKYDENGDADLSGKAGRATDPNLKNRDAVSAMSTFLATAANPANTKVSLWFFGGDTPATAQPKFDAQSQEDHFTDDLELPGEVVGNLPDPPPRPSNVYQALKRIVERDLGIDQYEDHEKFLYLITDGPNQVWDDDATKDKVLSMLNEHDVHLNILHLDSQVDPDLLRDVPTYWAGSSQCQDDESCRGAQACNSDADCANFETCRKGTIYADESGGSVSETAVEYCLPDYSDGQLGPIGPYADMACQTGGHYIHATDPQQLVYWARKLPFAIDGQWSIEAEISALDPKVGLPDGYYKLSGTFMGLLAPNTASTMSAVSSSGVSTHSPDNRGLLRVENGD